MIGFFCITFASLVSFLDIILDTTFPVSLTLTPS